MSGRICIRQYNQLIFYLNSPPWTSKEYDILKIRPTNVTPNFLFLIFIPFRETYGDEMSFIILENTTNWCQRLQRCSQVISFNFCFDIVCVKNCSVFCCGFKMTERFFIRVVKKVLKLPWKLLWPYLLLTFSGTNYTCSCFECFYKLQIYNET